MSDLRSSARIGAQLVLILVCFVIALWGPVAVGFYLFGGMGAVAGFFSGVFVAGTGFAYFTR